MEHIWAPWRMEYVGQPEPQPGCVFCNKYQEDADEANHIIYRGPRVFVMLNLYPYNSGHLMVIPYRHTGSLIDVDPGVSADMLDTARLAVRALDEVMHPEGYNLGINQGKIAGAGVADHIHLHVVPRWGGDTNFMPVLADVKVMPELLASTAAKLRPVLENLAAGGQ